MASAELTDPRSARVRRLRRLARRAYRAEQRQFLVEGAQAVREALEAARDRRATVREVLATSDATVRHAELLALAEQVGAPATLMTGTVASALSDTVTPQGIVAVADLVDVSLEAVLSDSPRLVAVLADVRDPGNAGSVIRAADAAGADAVVFAGDSVDPHNGKAVRASVGGIFHLKVVTGVGIAEAVQRLRDAGLGILVADGSGDQSLDGQGDILTLPTAWVFGNEAWGVPPAVCEQADTVVRIPIYGRAESLNLATAAALCLYASAGAQRE